MDGTTFSKRLMGKFNSTSIEMADRSHHRLYKPTDATWFDSVPLTVVTTGWLSVSPYRAGREALRFTAEVSYFVDGGDIFPAWRTLTAESAVNGMTGEGWPRAKVGGEFPDHEKEWGYSLRLAVVEPDVCSCKTHDPKLSRPLGEPDRRLSSGSAL